MRIISTLKGILKITVPVPIQNVVVISFMINDQNIKIEMHANTSLSVPIVKIQKEERIIAVYNWKNMHIKYFKIYVKHAAVSLYQINAIINFWLMIENWMLKCTLLIYEQFQ